MKITTKILLVLILIITLVSCGKSDPLSEYKSNEQNEQETLNTNFVREGTTTNYSSPNLNIETDAPSTK